MENIIKEIEFWTQIMKDHGEFQYLSLAPNEVEYIRTAEYFKNLFGNLYNEVKGLGVLSNEQNQALIVKNKNALIDFINFKKLMLAKLLSCQIKLGMTPTFINHMINEAMEFYRVLALDEHSQHLNKTLENLRLHKIWLPDASGHAKYIASSFDGIELTFVKQAYFFVDRFDSLFKKSFEMYIMYDRTHLESNELIYFNLEVEKTITEFISFLESLKELKAECKIFTSGLFSPLVPDHMIREEKYYLYKINEFK